MNICRIRMHVVPVYMRTHVRAGTLKAVMFVALVHMYMIGELCHGFERSLPVKFTFCTPISRALAMVEP